MLNREMEDMRLSLDRMDAEQHLLKARAVREVADLLDIPRPAALHWLQLSPYSLDSSADDFLQDVVDGVAPDSILASVDLGIGLIYFIQYADSPGSPVKIGWTSQYVEKRLSGLGTSTWHKIRILGSVQGTERVEHSLHRVFSDERINPRREWFVCTPRLMRLIACVNLAGVLPNDPANPSIWFDRCIE